ncbi:MAG: 4-(cytidine 5'-diphospho)-2-C-methyl-D-erythritol kinase [Ruminococcaceae bacterium]|nr:4-(cytidine 5'-diphospho)-2-C-methyl-D-erythritol kinase [Oscillospiraceae bacterium]
MKITVDAPAKINLFLDIIGKLDNGYHSLFMVMQSVDLCDEVTIEESNEKGIFLTCSDSRLPTDEKNIAYKAAKKFCDAAGVEPSVKIHIEKRIPFAAGLAGGSADAAAVIVGLNALLKTDYSQVQLCEIGLSIGSDVPFCIVGGTCLSQNTGGVLSALKPLKACYIVLAKPEAGVSTAEAYAAADNTYLYRPDSMRMLDACEKGDFESICKYAGNVFEQVIEVPERVEFKRIMRKNGASLCQMSGSGPTVFAVFEKKEDAENCANEIKNVCPNVFVTTPVSYGATEVNKDDSNRIF